MLQSYDYAFVFVNDVICRYEDEPPEPEIEVWCPHFDFLRNWKHVMKLFFPLFLQI